MIRETDRIRRLVGGMGGVRDGMTPRDYNGFQPIKSWAEGKTKLGHWQPQATRLSQFDSDRSEVRQANNSGTPTAVERSFRDWARVQNDRTPEGLRALIEISH